MNGRRVSLFGKIGKKGGKPAPPNLIFILVNPQRKKTCSGPSGIAGPRFPDFSLDKPFFC
jgi:hypothetical protein